MPLTDFTGNNDDNDAGNNGIGNGVGIGGNIGGNPTMPSGVAKALMGDADIDIEDILINYNEKFKVAQPTLFRDSVIRDTIGILIGKLKPNPLLVGAAGVGKTKIVEDIARRLAANDALLPDDIKGYTIYELPLSSLVAGAGIVGQLESRISAVIDFATNPKNKAILFIDEIHQLANGDAQVYGKIAQQLKPALARSDMHVIGATTSQEANNFLHDPAFSRRFSRVLVDELSKENTFEILKLSLPKYIKSGITVTDDVCQHIVTDADDYRYANNHRPDNALTLLDRAISFKVMQRKETEVSLLSNPAQLQAFKQIPTVALSVSDVRKTAVRLLMGGAEKPTVNEQLLRDAFGKIQGQDEAVEIVIKEVKRRERAIFPLTKPATFLFSGASGVGKTAIANILAKVVTGMKPITLNMPEYNSEASINRIIGVPEGYKGCDSNQELPFDILETNPYQIILLDEFEKCDRSVQRLFMSVFDQGTLSTNAGKTLDFSKAIIIATTNAGCTTDSSPVISFTEETSKTDISSFEGFFDIELINRFTHKVKFNNISKETYRNIVSELYKTMIEDVKSRIRKVSLPDELDDAELDRIVEDSYNFKLGARPAENYVRHYIEENA